MGIGNRMNELRTRKGLTLRETADLSGFSLSQYRRFETGIHEPKLMDLPRIAKALGIPASELVRYHPQASLCIKLLKGAYDVLK